MDSDLHRTPKVPAPVVVGVDGSSNSVHALMWAAEEAVQRGGSLRIVHAWTIPVVALTTPPMPPTFVDPTIFEVQAGELVADAAATVRARLGQHCPPIETSVVAGQPVAVLLDAAREGCLMVVGSNGRGVVARAVLGSVAEECLAHSTVPVVVVRENLVPESDGPVVVGIENTPVARNALAWAALEAGRLGRRLVVVHAHDVDTTLRPDLAGLPSELDGAMTRSARGFLDHLLTSVAVLGGRPRSVAWRVVAGDPKRALVDAAVGASMLVLGSPHPHGVVEHVVGSTARHCVREANCPVVIVPAAGPEALECAS